MFEAFLKLNTELQIAIGVALVCVFLIVRLLLSKGLVSFFKIQIDHLANLRQKNKLLNYLTIAIVTWIVLVFANQSSWPKDNTLYIVLSKLLMIVIVISVGQVLNGIIRLADSLYSHLEIARSRSIRPIIQVLSMLVYVGVILVIIAVISNTNPITLLAGASAVTAVLGLIFKDIILSFYAGMYLSTAEMIKLGDYIYIQSLSIGGTVKDIGMSHVSLTGLDNTTTTLPSYTLLQNDITNYSSIGPQSGRRLEKTLYIDAKKVVMIDEDKVATYIKKYDLEPNTIINTNADLLCATVTQYMKKHQSINSEGTVACSLSNQKLGGLELNIIASTTIGGYSEFISFSSRILSMIVFYINHFGLHRD